MKSKFQKTQVNRKKTVVTPWASVHVLHPKNHHIKSIKMNMNKKKNNLEVNNDKANSNQNLFEWCDVTKPNSL